MSAERAASWGPLDHAAEEGDRALVFLFGFMAPTGRYRYEVGYEVGYVVTAEMREVREAARTDEHGRV